MFFISFKSQESSVSKSTAFWLGKLLQKFHSHGQPPCATQNKGTEVLEQNQTSSKDRKRGIPHETTEKEIQIYKKNEKTLGIPMCCHTCSLHLPTKNEEKKTLQRSLKNLKVQACRDLKGSSLLRSFEASSAG